MDTSTHTHGNMDTYPKQQVLVLSYDADAKWCWRIQANSMQNGFLDHSVALSFRSLTVVPVVASSKREQVNILATHDFFFFKSVKQKFQSLRWRQQCATGPPNYPSFQFETSRLQSTSSFELGVKIVYPLIYLFIITTIISSITATASSSISLSLLPSPSLLAMQCIQFCSIKTQRKVDDKYGMCQSMQHCNTQLSCK